MEKQIEDQLREWHLDPVVRALMGLKGYQMIAAMIVVGELGDIHRFDHPRRLMASSPGLAGSPRWSEQRRQRQSAGSPIAPASLNSC
ncbi:MAG: transposase [Verrucomicrobiales bacterium]